MKSPPPNLNSFSTTLPELRTERETYQAEILKRKLECAAIRTRIQNTVPDPGNERQNRVNALLGRPTAPLVQPDDARLQTLLVEIQDFQNAVADIDAKIQKETRLANAKLIESVSPEINRLGNRFAQAFADLHGAHLEFDDYIDDLENVGASVGHFRIRPNGLSFPKDLSGSYAYGLKEFIDSGFFQKSNMPKVLK